MSLCTVDPLHYHHTREPVMEEYGAAAKIFKLSVVDMCARRPPVVWCGGCLTGAAVCFERVFFWQWALPF